MINNFEPLAELLASTIDKANGAMPEIERANLLVEAMYETAMFLLATTPTTGHHQAYLATELLKRLRNFHSPFFVIAREMGDEAALRQHFETFITATRNWPTSQH